MGTDSVQRIETVVIGAGQTGLSAGYHLARHGRSFVILDAGRRVGDHWRDRWDSLRLYSPARSDALPGMAFPAPAYHYPTGREMGDYLEAYAARFELPVRSGARVERLGRSGDGFALATSAGPVVADNVIVATGPFHHPYVPPFASKLDPSIRQLHSHEYRNPSQLQDGPVLVVGLSHSGGDIALETAATHPTIVAGRFHGQLPVRVIDTPRARVLWPVIAFALGNILTIRTPLGRRARSKVRSGGAPLLRVRLPDIAAAGVEHVDARVEGVRDGRPVLGDGRAVDVANVIWATGYRREYGWIDLPVLGPDGWPDEERGVSRTVPGLYFLGVPFSYAFTSMLVAGAGRDAGYVVDRLVTAGAGARSRAAAPASA